MFVDAESKVSGLGEVFLSQFVLLDLETTLEDLLSLGATDSNMDSDLLVTSDTESTDGVAGLACMCAQSPVSLLSFQFPRHFLLVSLGFPDHTKSTNPGEEVCVL